MTNVNILTFLIVLSGFVADVLAQPRVPVAESTLKVAAFSEEEFHYGFAAGDQVYFTFQEMNGKPLKELEIKEVAGNTVFMDYKTEKINSKVITVQHTGIYQFRFQNDGLVGRVCRFTLERIPAHDSLKNFNTSVYWRTEYDTTYIAEDERYLVKTDTLATVVTDQVVKVSSQTAMNGNPNKALVDFTLPDGTRSWSYYIGVGREGQDAYNNSRDRFFDEATASVIQIPGYGPLAALALLGINLFTQAGGGDNVKYWFISDGINVEAFQNGQSFYQYKQGDVLNDASQMKSPLAGKVYLGLMNDNIREAIDVQVKVTAIQFRPVWTTRTVQRIQVTLRKIPYLKS